MTSYTHIPLAQIKDSAGEFGLAGQTARFANEALELQDTGCAYLTYAPDAHNGFGHRHVDAEEVYVVLAGSGRIKVEDEVIELEHRDAIRVAATATRAFSAGPGGMEVIAFGPRHPEDGEVSFDWWPDDR